MGMLRAVLLAECALVLAMVLTALPPAMGAIGREIATDPDHPGTCLLRRKGNTGIRMKNGEERNLPNCMLSVCYDNGKDMVLQYYTCGLAGINGCRHPIRDMSKPYPGCCEVTCE
ncbi:uncharacterized protein LOC123515494 [Portunus trituberculatus]|uniref:uncharacterized protein LOC123515494 n=1 Tax=Portunus trituberculatus TaxID=210409 RepID=UPI001E1CC170|nr:uncharacterized protein LOC123515494 [Portunus trituberculatus]